MNDYVPRVLPTLEPFGGRYLVRGGKTVASEGEPPKRFVIIAFDSMERLQGWRDSPAAKDLRARREKIAEFRQFAVEGAPR